MIMQKISALSPSVRGALLVALSGLLFGWMSFFGVRLLSFNFSLQNMLFWRFFMASVWMAFWIFFRSSVRRKKILSGFTIKPFIAGALAYSGASAFYFLAIQYIYTGLAMVVFFSFPIFVALMAWIMGSWKMNRVAFCALFSVVAGLFLLKGDQDASNVSGVGILLAMLGALSFAFYVYGSQQTTRKHDSQLLTLSVCVGNSFIFLVWSLITNTFAFPISLSAWIYAVAIGVIATALPIQLLLDGLKTISSVKASILSVLEPVVTILVGFAFLHESMTLIQLAGVLVILSAAILIQFEGKMPELLIRNDI